MCRTGRSQNGSAAPGSPMWATLIPLADALGLTVPELLRGERDTAVTPDDAARETAVWARHSRRAKRQRAVRAAVTGLVCTLALWCALGLPGLLSLPVDWTAEATVYRADGSWAGSTLVRWEGRLFTPPALVVGVPGAHPDAAGPRLGGRAVRCPPHRPPAPVGGHPVHPSDLEREHPRPGALHPERVYFGLVGAAVRLPPHRRHGGGHLAGGLSAVFGGVSAGVLSKACREKRVRPLMGPHPFSLQH